ncbi:MAG TPA: endonuclease domain-containing protein [Polyangiaceae bacterium]|nr:endonuclease domain-containing protein [Polyangiaceae bacterium]HPB99266.1 endonuclease domain-containing protein [Polyangiaceae bacterium]HQB45856.1 endonuclease domain-containing protein [Polyangiaceae bacterium]HQK16077.1 endonuclease domain-containing protein [Polyangiaceae bacterium]
MSQRRCSTTGARQRREATEAIRRLARRLRGDLTQAEQILWQELRGRTLGGFKFRRQHIVAGYVVDFYCPATRLAIEVDGPVHETQQSHDKARDAIIESQGIALLRITNDDVHQQLEQVRNAILCACRTRATKPDTPKRKKHSRPSSNRNCGIGCPRRRSATAHDDDQA